MGTNKYHVDYIAKEILGKYGIKKYEDYIIGVVGTQDLKPLIVVVIFVLNDQEYERTFEIKNVDSKSGCEDINNCV